MSLSGYVKRLRREQGRTDLRGGNVTLVRIKQNSTVEKRSKGTEHETRINHQGVGCGAQLPWVGPLSDITVTPLHVNKVGKT